MAETVGRVDFIAGLDGRSAVRESRQLGDEIGREGEKAGAGFGDRFDRELTPRMKLAADKAARALSSGLQLDGKILDRNRAQIEKFTSSTSGEFRKMSAETREAFAQMFPNVDGQLGRLNSRLRETWDNIEVGEGRLHGLNLQWSDLSHNTRQWTLIIGAVLAGMQDLAVLSSAAGAGIFAVGGALTAAVAGGGAAVAIFSVLAKDIGDLPPELRATASQFKALGTELVNTRDIIASAAIQQMPNTFARLQGTVEALNPSFGRLGAAVGTVFDDFSKGVAEGSDGFRELNALVDNAANDFPKLAAATGTWTQALLRGVNRANPMVDQLIGYVEKLGSRFDSFTRSNSFDQWIANSMQTFRAFGDLLDATGLALNNLVTPTSIVRTQQFLDNLTAFMPNLSRLLDMLGRLDVFGLAAQLLNEFGAALEPLSGPAMELADSLNDVASILISELATGLGLVASIVAPVATGLSNIIDAIPPEVLAGVATGVLGVAAAFAVLRGAQGLAGAANAALMAVDSFGALAIGTGRAEAAAGKLATGLKSIAGKAGLFGLAAVGALALFDALTEVARGMAGVDDSARNLLASNATLEESYLKLSDATSQGFDLVAIKDWDKALTDLSYTNDGVFANMANAWRDGATEAFGLAGALGEMDKKLAPIAQNSLPSAVSQFSAWATEVGATDAQVLNMLNSMPLFKAELENAAAASGQLATDTELVKLALGESTIGVETTRTALELLGSSSYLTGEEILSLSDKIRGFGEQNLTARDAARTYEAAIDDLTASIAENGATLDIGTEQGRANEAALDALAVATLDLSAKTLAQTGEQSKANDTIAAGREQLITMLGQFGITGTAAQQYADKLGLIPAEVSSTIQARGLAEAYNTTGNLQYRLEQINGSTYSYTMRGTYIQMGNREITPFAAGGQVNGPTRALIGEAGPELIVPLRRPLSLVDPSVRWLSAIAQGKMPAMASGGGAGGGTTNHWAPGSIVVEAAEDPRATALEVVDEIADLAGS